MRLCSFTHNSRTCYGLATEDGIVDLGRRLVPQTLRELLRAGVEAALPFAEAPPDYRLVDIRWLPPIVDPAHILAIGLNTRDHRAEVGSVGAKAPPYPRVFMRSPKSQVGHLEQIWLPRASQQLDYEGEIACIIGVGGRRISKSRALDHVAGYACYNDGSVRDFQHHTDNSTTAGKNFIRSGAFGPWIATSDEIPDPCNLRLETRVNGALRQSMAGDEMIFSVADIISYLSEIFELEPGDVILTGTSAGVGATTGTWLREGDIVSVAISAVGTLQNRVVAEPI